MGKKKKEHMTFDGMNKQKKTMPVGKINQQAVKGFHNKIG